ncbi:MAG: hypothetical protein IJG52_03555 [Lachnospiraceae bacterium]|nr:hypothetical protein [Lachnospiraceae bacterium]MBQ3392471.1 hypothetical protein [Lachnospiraceae bacterium]
MKKKAIAIFLAVTTALSAAACGGTGGAASLQDRETAAQETADPQSEGAGEEAAPEEFDDYEALYEDYYGDDYDYYGDYYDWYDSYSAASGWSLEDYQAELDAAVEDGRITQEEHDKVLHYYELQDEYDKLYDEATGTEEYKEAAAKISDEYYDLLADVYDLENKTNYALASAGMTGGEDAAAEGALTEEERAYLDEAEQIKAETGEYSDEEMASSVDALYDKIYEYQLAQLTEQGTLTKEEQEQLTGAYARMDELDGEREQLLKDTLEQSGSAERLAQIESEMDELQDEVWEISRKLY